MASTRELKGRIVSVQSSQKITGAMKMISSARLRKAETVLYNARPYREQLDRLLARVSSADVNYQSPLGEKRPVKRAAVVLFSSNEGLCGAFNVGLYKKLLEALTEYGREGVTSLPVYLVGNKLQGDLRRTIGVELRAVPEAFGRKDYAGGSAELAEELMKAFLAGELDRVELVYSRYKSIGRQEVVREQLLPWCGQVEEEREDAVYIYEPDRRSILDMLYPLVVHATVYRALIENQTSEHAARIMSMQTANDNANKLLKSLQLEYNKLRQQAITTELLDIVGGTVE